MKLWVRQQICSPIIKILVKNTWRKSDKWFFFTDQHFCVSLPLWYGPKLSLLTKTFTDLFCQRGWVIQWWRRWFLWCSSNLRRIHFESKLTDGLSLVGFSLNRNVSLKGEDTHTHCIFVECVLTNIHQEMYGYIRVRTNERNVSNEFFHCEICLFI